MPYTKAQLIELVQATARRFGIDEKVAVAQINQESGFNPAARSGAGARGIAQFMPATAARFGLTNPNDPVAAMTAWGKYMSFLLNRYNGDYSKALAGYNAGEGNVDKYKGVPPFAETQNYVKSILSNAGRSISDFVSGGSVGSSGGGYSYQSASVKIGVDDLKPVSPETKKAIIIIAAGLTMLVALVYASR